MLRPRHLAGDEGHRLTVPQRDFNSQGYGYVTNGGLIVDGSGNVFGTAWTSVTNYPTSGPTFELVKSSSGYKYVVLLGGSFEPPTFCGPVFGTKGNIYEDGFGAGCPDCPGAIYKNDRVIDANTWVTVP